jgi:hypothetical protein
MMTHPKDILDIVVLVVAVVVVVVVLRKEYFPSDFLL